MFFGGWLVAGNEHHKRKGADEIAENTVDHTFVLVMKYKEVAPFINPVQTRMLKYILAQHPLYFHAKCNQTLLWCCLTVNSVVDA